MCTCDICGGTATAPLPFYYQLDDTLLLGHKCKSCQLMFIHPQPNESQIRALYGEDYFSKMENYNREQRHVAYMELAKNLDFSSPQPHKFTDYILKRYPGKKFKFLEVGCGPGYLLKRLQLLGWEVSGLEISEFSASFGREHFGLPIQTGNIETFTDFTENQWEMVYMGDVLEHLRSPSAVIANFRRMLTPGGLLVLALPSTMNLPSIRAGLSVYNALGRKRKMDIPPYHLFEFTPASTRKLLEKHGFEVADLVNTVKKPTQIRLGGNKLEMMGKLVGQYPTYYLNKLTGDFGDRIWVVARNVK
jgi:2-polyprenyl-3-methyl-5-hydroxy-6-metoxy-1,4-benzoquinol methylase